MIAAAGGTVIDAASAMSGLAAPPDMTDAGGERFALVYYEARSGKWYGIKAGGGAWVAVHTVPAPGVPGRGTASPAARIRNIENVH